MTHAEELARMAADTELSAPYREAAAWALERLTEFKTALQWCSGSADFSDSGIAREGWVKICAPLMEGGAA